MCSIYLATVSPLSLTHAEKFYLLCNAKRHLNLPCMKHEIAFPRQPMELVGRNVARCSGRTAMQSHTLSLRMSHMQHLLCAVRCSCTCLRGLRRASGFFAEMLLVKNKNFSKFLAYSLHTAFPCRFG